MRKKYLLLLYFTFCVFYFAVGQSAPIILQQSNSSNVTSNSVSLDFDKNIIVTGKFSGSLSLGANSMNYSGSYCTKYDSTGQNLWMIPAGATATSPQYRNPNVCTDVANNIYILGVFNDTCYIGDTILTDTIIGNTFLAKISPSGNTLWAKKISRSNVKFYGLNIDHSGNILLSGMLTGTIILDSVALIAQDYDVLTIRLDNFGNLKWMKRAGGPNFVNSELAYSISSDFQDNIYITGHVRSINPTFDTIVIPVSSTAGFTGFIAKYDTSGNAMWARACSYQSFAISTDSAGNSAVGGYDLGSSASIIRVNSSGNIMWSRYLQANYSNTSGISTDNLGNVYAVGVLRGITQVFGTTDSLTLQNNIYPGGNTGFIIIFDSTGNPTWSNLVKNSNYSIEINDIDVNDCQFAFAGYFNNTNTVYYGNDSLVNLAGADGFVILENGCSVLSEIQTSVKFEKNAFCYPNPTNDILNITLNNTNTPFTITVTNIMGKQIFTTSTTTVNYKLQTSNFSKGIYFVKVIKGNETLVQKFMKE